MEIITEEIKDIKKATNIVVDGVKIIKEGPIKFFFKKTTKYFFKKKTTNAINKNIINPINEQILKPTKKTITELKEKSDDFIYECGEKVKNCKREVKFNFKKFFEGVTNKDEKINSIKSLIENNEKINNIIILINEKNIKLDLKDKLEIIEYAIKREKKKISQSLIKDITKNIKNKSKKLRKQKETINILNTKINKLKKQREIKNKWYGKIIKFFNKNYFNKVEKNLNNIKENLIYHINKNKKSIDKNTKKYLLAYKNNGVFNSDNFNNFKKNINEKSKALELNKTINSLSSAIFEINEILLEKQNIDIFIN